MRVVYVAGDGPLEGASYALEDRLPVTEELELDESSRAAALEAVVDVHTFVPRELEQLARRQGATDVRVTTSELFASWFGWPVRTFECAVPKEKLGLRWATFALRGWQALSAVDERLEGRVPAGLFYNAEITGRKA